jgi:hypothetical protein
MSPCSTGPRGSSFRDWNKAALIHSVGNNTRNENQPVATDYDEVRSDVKESQKGSL